MKAQYLMGDYSYTVYALNTATLAGANGMTAAAVLPLVQAAAIAHGTLTFKVTGQ